MIINCAIIWWIWAKKYRSIILNLLVILCYFLFCSVNIVYVTKDGKKHPVKGKIGDNALYLAHRYGIEMEGMYML